MVGHQLLRITKAFAGSLLMLSLSCSVSAFPVAHTNVNYTGRPMFAAVEGFVQALDGRGLDDARVVASAPATEDLHSQTNPFGHFRFTQLTPGKTYTFTVTHKRFQFASRTVTVTDNIDLAFVALPVRTGFALDPEFGTGGKVTTDLGGNDRAYIVLSQSEGMFAVVGSSNNNPAIVRYRTDGRLDTSYGMGGKVISLNLRMAIDLNIKPAAVQADGKIVIGGGNANFDFVLERRNVDGSVDQTFGGGLVILNFAPNSSDHVKAVAVQPDGKILAVGQVNLGTTDTAIGIARFNADGSLDNAFGVQGRAVANTPSLEDPRAVAIQPDGKIVICGIQQSTRQILVRLMPDGSLDASFGTNGIAVHNEINLLGYDLSIQRDGKLLAIGEGLARYNTDGSLDLPFNGPQGSIGVPNVELQAVGLRADGTILAAGRSFQSATTGGDFGVALVHPFTGQLISRIDTDILFQRFEDPKDIYVQPDGKIVLAGYIAPASTTDFALVRYVNF